MIDYDVSMYDYYYYYYYCLFGDDAPVNWLSKLDWFWLVDIAIGGVIWPLLLVWLFW